jgi:hypothetical protein
MTLAAWRRATSGAWNDTKEGEPEKKNERFSQFMKLMQLAERTSSNVRLEDSVDRREKAILLLQLSAFEDHA